jgi:hypothetical protein
MYSASTATPVTFEVFVSDYDTEGEYSNGNYQGLTEYEANELGLLYGDGTAYFMYGGRQYHHYYNIGTFENP